MKHHYKHLYMYIKPVTKKCRFYWLFTVCFVVSESCNFLVSGYLHISLHLSFWNIKHELCRTSTNGNKDFHVKCDTWNHQFHVVFQLQSSQLLWWYTQYSLYRYAWVFSCRKSAKEQQEIISFDMLQIRIWHFVPWMLKSMNYMYEVHVVQILRYILPLKAI